MYTDQEVRRIVGLSDPKSVVFIKQHGARRTGTNALRALVIRNFTNVFVLIHILGDKHSPPLDLRQIHAAVGTSDDAAWRFVASTTSPEPASTMEDGNYLRLRFLRALQEPLFEAFRDRRFYYLISIRNPYRWASSVLRSIDWPDEIPAGTWDHRRAEEILMRECRRFNDNYRAWLALHNDVAPRSLVVPAEKLRGSWTGVLEDIQYRTRLPRRAPEFLPIARPVAPTPWDYFKSKANDEWFPRAAERPAVRLTEGLHDVVTTHVDWPLIRPFGYDIEPFAGPGVA